MTLAQVTVFGLQTGDIATGIIFIIGIIAIFVFAGMLFNRMVAAQANRLPQLNQKELNRLAREAANNELNVHLKRIDEKTKKLRNASVNLASMRKDKDLKAHEIAQN